MEIKKVGVIGCGAMGGGIAQVCAQTGYTVVVSEINDQLLNKGLAAINANLTKNVDKGRISAEDKEATLARLKGTTDMKDFSDCDLIIEAALERMDVKKQIFAQLDQICPPHTLLATNTSSLSIIDVATATKRPTQVLGLHFFNPPQVMKLCEVARTVVTSDEVIATGKIFAESLGKTAVIAKDTPGLLANRLVSSFWVNAINMYDAGVATREDIDNAAKLGLNHPMGPLELADFVGLDIVLALIQTMYDEFQEQRYIPPLLLKKMVTAGMLGRKSGRGFYDYSK